MSLALVEIPAYRLPEFRPELDAILARCPKGYTLDWILERIDAGALHPLALTEDDRAVGLALVSVDESGPRRALILFGIALLRSAGRGARGHEASDRPRRAPRAATLAPSLRLLARHLGCAVIQGVSSRRGWLRHARPVGTIYEMEV